MLLRWTGSFLYYLLPDARFSLRAPFLLFCKCFYILCSTFDVVMKVYGFYDHGLKGEHVGKMWRGFEGEKWMALQAGIYIFAVALRAARPQRSSRLAFSQSFCWSPSVFN